MAGSSKRTARAVAVKTWRAKALVLRVQGSTYAEIGKTLGKAPSTVHEAIETELAAIPAEGVEQLRSVHGMQLDNVIRGSLKKALAGDSSAAFAVIGAINAKAKLFGLNAIEKIDVNAELSLTEDAHQQLLDRLARIVAPPAKAPS